MHEADLIDDVLRLSSGVWGTKLTDGDVLRWLDNFDGRALGGDVAAERLNAIHLLSQFIYFGHGEIRVLLKALYRDLYTYPIVRKIRSDLGGTRDTALVSSMFSTELSKTRFLGMGNPSESGVHLLYFFRQENLLPKRLFIHAHEIFDGPVSAPATRLALPGVERLVFIDDLLGSGQQAAQYSSTFLADVQRVARLDARPIEVQYLVLFAKDSGLVRARSTLFNRVDAVHVLDESQNAFSISSRAYPSKHPGISLDLGRKLAATYGDELYPGHPLGFRDGQMLLGFHHNVPDNALPIFWANDQTPTWQTILNRYPKEVSLP